MSGQRIHQDQPVLVYGTPLEQAAAAVILLHGRGATAQSMRDLATYLPSEGTAYLMPQAANNTWYPNSGFVPLAANEPFLSSAMATIRSLIERVEAAGIPASKIVLGGFSQGACLASEFAAQHAQRYGGLLVFSGALMGPLDMPRHYDGSLSGTPVFIGGINRDPWVKEAQIRHTAAVLENLGGQVTLEILPGTEHTIRPNEIEHGSQLIAALADPAVQAARRDA